MYVAVYCISGIIGESNIWQFAQKCYWWDYDFE